MKMNFQPAFIFKIRQVILITVVWILAGILVELNNAIAYDPSSRSYSFYFVFGDSAVEHLLITAMGPLFGGLLAGSFIVFLPEGKGKGQDLYPKTFNSYKSLSFLPGHSYNGCWDIRGAE